MAADPEVILKDWLVDRLGDDIRGALTGPKKPSNLATVMPLLMVAHFGGSGIRGVQVSASVDVDIYAASEAGAKTLTGRIDDWLMVEEAMTNHITAEGHVVTGVLSQTVPMSRPYDSKYLVHKRGATYTLLLHPRAA